MVDQFLNVNFQVTKGDRKYTLNIPYNAPLGEVYDACHEMMQEVLSQAQKLAEKAKESRTQDPVIVD
jgi:hypothetical protein